MTSPEAPRQAGRSARRWSSWLRWSPMAAAVWSLAYGSLGLYWTLGGGGFPFGREGDSEAEYSILLDATADSVAPVIAVLGFVGALVAWVLAKNIGTGLFRLGVITFGWLTAAALAVVLTDLRIMMLVTRIVLTPLFLVTGVPGDSAASVADFYTWSRMNLIVVFAGGVLWGLATLAYQRRSAGACLDCGRGDEPQSSAWTSPESARRWGRWAVTVAMAIPLVYAASRVAMALESPLGVPDSFYAEMEGTGLIYGELFMAALAVVAALLTFGLIRPWGEVFPRWVWFRSGERVPSALAIVPGLVMSVVLTSMGVSELRLLLNGEIEIEEWGINGPGALWPLWGPALAAATYAYYLRRRQVCQHCGRGAEASVLELS